MSLRRVARGLLLRRQNLVSAPCLPPVNAQTELSLDLCRVPIDPRERAGSPGCGRQKTHRKSFFEVLVITLVGGTTMKRTLINMVCCVSFVLLPAVRAVGQNCCE